MKILLIRLRLIGDVVFTTPIPRALKRAFPASRITYLVERHAAAVVERNHHLDEVIVADRPSGLARIAADVRLARRLRRERFDLVLDLHGGPRSSWLAWATGAPQRIGYDIPGRRWMYTRTVARARELRPRHSVVNQWDLLGAIEGWRAAAPDPARDAVDMPLNPAADARMAERLRAHGVGREEELIIAHVSAGNPFRRWPEPAFVELVTALASASPRRRIVLSSGPSDRTAADRIAAAARQALGAAADRIVDFGEFDLAELRALIARGHLFVGGDTGPLHVAATTTTPIVGIYGPTLAARSAPWRDPRVPTESLEVAGLSCRPCDQRACEPGDFRCLTTLKPDEVISAAERALRAGA
ncbi:lipopolysaccharide heptosyltransferase II [soil metagenome]|nr:glycosyltransferase family 9 protein [Acidobacteriota bacterium]